MTAAPRALLPLFVLLALSGAASAHANLESAAPLPNSKLPTAPLPDAAVLRFSEPLDESFTRARLLDGEQNAVEAAPWNLTGPAEITLPLPDRLPDGVYVLSWRALSTVDGHTTAGAFVYIVGNASVPLTFDAYAPQSTGDAGRPSETAARASAMIGVFLLVGAAFFVLALDGPVAEAPASYRRAMVRIAAGGGALATAGAAAASYAYAARVDLPWVEALTGTRIGLLWVARILLPLAGALALAGLQARAARLAWAGALAGGALALLSQAMASHAGGLPYPVLGIGMDAAHLLAASAWVGGLPALAVALRGQEPTRKMALAVAFSALATWAVAAVLLSGLALSFAQLGNLANLWSTPWGRALLVKLGAVAGLLTLGAYNKLVLVPRIEREGPRAIAGLRRTVLGESAVALVLLLSVAVLTGESPPAQAGEPDGGSILTLSDQGRYGTAFTLRVAPANPLTPGLHLYDVALVDERGQRVTNANVTLRFTYFEEDIGTSEARLNLTDEDTYRGLAGNLALPGTWRVDVVVSGRPDAYDERVHWDVQVAG